MGINTIMKAIEEAADRHAAEEADKLGISVEEYKRRFLTKRSAYRHAAKSIALKKVKCDGRCVYWHPKHEDWFERVVTRYARWIARKARRG